MDWVCMFFWRLFCGIWLIATLGYCQVQWEPDVRLTDTLFHKAYPSDIAVSGDTVYVLFHGNWQWTGIEIYFTKTTDAGITWSQPSALSPIDSSTSEEAKVKTAEICIENYGLRVYN